MESIQERILQVIGNKGITPYRFCKDLNLSFGYLDKRGAIGTDKYLKIIEYLPDVNPSWLLSGNGKMMRGNENKIEEPLTPYLPEQIEEPDIEPLVSVSFKNQSISGEKIKALVTFYGETKQYPKRKHLVFFCRDFKLNYNQWVAYTVEKQAMGIKPVFDLIQIFPKLNLNWLFKNDPNMFTDNLLIETKRQYKSILSELKELRLKLEK